MSQLSRFLDQLSGVAQVAHSTLYLDLGSAASRVAFRGKVVYNHPSCATYHTQTATIVQLGQPALAAAGRAPGELTTIFPISQAYIADLTRAAAYIAAVVNQSLSSAQQKVVMSLSATYAVPASLSPMEKQMLTRTLKQAGLNRVRLVTKPNAIVAAVQKRGDAGTHLGVIDIGSHTTEIGLFVGSECRAATTIYMGADAFTQKIIQVVRQESQALVGWSTAERLKLQQKNLGFEPSEKDTQTIALRAKSLLNLNPTTVLLPRPILQNAFAEVADDLSDEVTAFLAEQDSELVASVLEQGLYVTGGGSRMQGLLEHLEQRLKTTLIKAAKPDEDVVLGLALATT